MDLLLLLGVVPAAVLIGLIIVWRKYEQRTPFRVFLKQTWHDFKNHSDIGVN